MSNPDLRAALEAVRNTLRRENDKAGGPIWDTIWHTPHETLLDFIDGALAQAATSAAGGAEIAASVEAELRAKMDAALAVQSPDSGAGTDLLALRGANETCPRCGTTGSHWCPQGKQGAQNG